MTVADKRNRVLGVYAKVLGRRYGVEIAFDASCKTAMTDGHTRIVLPPLDLGSDEDALLMEGLIDHEAGGHCRHTDFEAADALLRGQPPMVQGLANLMEDIWIERELIRSHPGCSHTLVEVLRILDKRGVWPACDPKAHPAAAMVGLLINGLRTVKNRQTLLQERFDGWWKVLQDQIGFDRVSAIWRTADQGIDGVRDSAAAVRLAKQLHALMKEPPQPPQPPQQQSGTGGSNDQASGGASQPTNLSDPGSQGGASPTGAQQGQPAATPGAPTAQQQANAQAMAAANAAHMGNTEMAETITAALNGTQPKPGVSYTQQGTGKGAGTDWTLRKNSPVQAPADRSSIESVARPISVQLGSRLDLLLTTQVEERSELRRSGRRLVSRLLPAAVSAGRSQIFRHRDEQEGIDTSLMILTDISGSMGAALQDGVTRIETASAATQALGDVLARFDLPFAIRYFGSALTPVKGFDQPWRAARALTYARLEGSTVTHSALSEVIPEIAARDERRRLLILITDGLPSDRMRTTAALSEAQKLGLQAAVLLISDASAEMESFRKDLVRANVSTGYAPQPQDIAKAVFAAVTTAVH